MFTVNKLLKPTPNSWLSKITQSSQSDDITTTLWSLPFTGVLGENSWPLLISSGSINFTKPLSDDAWIGYISLTSKVLEPQVIFLISKQNTHSRRWILRAICSAISTWCTWSPPKSFLKFLRSSQVSVQLFYQSGQTLHIPSNLLHITSTTTCKTDAF